MGRPAADKPKAIQLSVRLDVDTLQRLDVIATANAETRGKTLRRGIDLLYADYLKKDK